MGFKELVNERRAYRSLEKVKIDLSLIEDLADTLKLAPSCFNYQPWRYVFVYDDAVLKQMHTALSTGNEWAQEASMMVAVFANKESDCVIKNREYYLFDTGMATAYLILRATELGFIAHPIAGFKHKLVREILHIPEGKIVIALVIIGKRAAAISYDLSDKQVEAEKQRPTRLSNSSFIFYNQYNEKSQIKENNE